MGVIQKWGMLTSKWMVYKLRNPWKPLLKLDDLGVQTIFEFKDPHLPISKVRLSATGDTKTEGPTAQLEVPLFTAQEVPLAIHSF